MLIRKFTIAVLVTQQLFAQGNHKITGPLGIYHITAGYCYSDSTGTDSTLVQSQFQFGEFAMPDQSIDNGFGFQAELDSCNQWAHNKVLAIIQPLTEGGVNNQPGDTALYAPYPQSNGPGMIQGGQRFSKLSQLYSGFCGVVLDDWGGDTVVTREVRDAVQGKYVDADGNVHSECVATTPNNKLYAVIYGTDPRPSAMPVVDGFFYSLYQGQNCCYTGIDNDINQLVSNFPQKEIVIAIFIKNSLLGWVDPASVQYMLQHSLDRYDDGDINGITLFAGPFFPEPDISLSLWNSYALPYWLDSLYYPYLGQGQGTLYDCNTGNTLNDAFVGVYCKSKSTGDTLSRSYQKTNADGKYQFGLWAGNRNTDSTYYWMIAEKSGYISDTVGFWIKRLDTSYIPNISLCPAPYSPPNPAGPMLLFPNPGNGVFTVELPQGQSAGDELDIYDMQGTKVYAAPMNCKYAHVDLSMYANGVYLAAIKTSDKKIDQRKLFILQR